MSESWTYKSNVLSTVNEYHYYTLYPHHCNCLPMDFVISFRTEIARAGFKAHYGIATGIELALACYLYVRLILQHMTVIVNGMAIKSSLAICVYHMVIFR